jgi:hypothetical protein
MASGVVIVEKQKCVIVICEVEGSAVALAVVLLSRRTG